MVISDEKTIINTIGFYDVHGYGFIFDTHKGAGSFVSAFGKTGFNEDGPDLKSADLNYNNDCRANREQDTNAKPAVDTVIKSIKQYDTIFIGYPIWHGKEPGVIRTFLSKTKLKGKIIKPFCTSGGSGISGSMSHIRKLAAGATVKSGRDLTDASDKEIKKWVTKK